MKRSPRFTPTRVGTTPTSLASKPDLPVHPHARGDNYVVEHRGSGHAGSPPRAWGQLVLDYRIAMIVRFTPTRVGTTQVLTGALPRSPVHPHARGDNTTHGDAREPFAGSPPRAWGQLSVRSQHLRRHRFTPTRVGTTNTLYRCTATNTVHPHARGDNLGFSRAPRGRGRFTPTRVGTTSSFWFGWPRSSGSPPRAWGQLLSALRAQSAMIGSPPRAWGQHIQAIAVAVSVTVHPHARGDNTYQLTDSAACAREKGPRSHR